MDFNSAFKIGSELIELLKPYTTRIEFGGSLRRGKSEIRDIDIVLIPDKYKLEQFLIYKRHEHQIETKNSLNKLKSGPKYKQILFRGHKVELWLANPDNWGVIFLIRTGPWEFSKKMMGTQLPKNGYNCDEGKIWRGEKIIKTPEEHDVFDLCKMTFVPPDKRF